MVSRGRGSGGRVGVRVGDRRGPGSGPDPGRSHAAGDGGQGTDKPAPTKAAVATASGPIAVDKTIDDSTLRATLAELLPQYPGVRRVEVHVRDGVVKLEGQVDDDDTRDDLTDFTRRVEGVRLVLNRTLTDEEAMTGTQLAVHDVKDIWTTVQRKWRTSRWRRHRWGSRRPRRPPGPWRPAAAAAAAAASAMATEVGEAVPSPAATVRLPGPGGRRAARRVPGTASSTTCSHRQDGTRPPAPDPVPQAALRYHHGHRTPGEHRGHDRATTRAAPTQPLGPVRPGDASVPPARRRPGGPSSSRGDRPGGGVDLPVGRRGRLHQLPHRPQPPGRVRPGVQRGGAGGGRLRPPVGRRPRRGPRRAPWASLEWTSVVLGLVCTAGGSSPAASPSCASGPATTRARCCRSGSWWRRWWPGCGSSPPRASRCRWSSSGWASRSCCSSGWPTGAAGRCRPPWWPDSAR